MNHWHKFYFASNTQLWIDAGP